MWKTKDSCLFIKWKTRDSCLFIKGKRFKIEAKAKSKLLTKNRCKAVHTGIYSDFLFLKLSKTGYYYTYEQKLQILHLFPELIFF